MTEADHATPQEAPNTGPRPNFLAAVGQAAAFLGSGLNAVIEFFFSAPSRLPEVSEEDAPAPAEVAADRDKLLERAEDKASALARKLAPFPGQEG